MTSQGIIKVYIPVTLGVMMLAMGLGLRSKDFRTVLTAPRAVLLGVLNQLFLLPAVGFAIAFGFGLTPEFAVGLVLVTACPGGPTSNLYSHLARGDTALSVSLTAISGIATILTIPLITTLALTTFMGESTTISMDPFKTLQQLLAIVGAPLVVGMLLRARVPAFAIAAEGKVKTLAIMLLVILISGAVAKEWSRILDHALTLGLPVITLSLGTIALGYGTARLARLSKPQAVTIAIETGMQNAALGIGLALTVLGSEAIAMPAVVYGILAYFTCALPVAIGRRMIAPASV